MELIYKYSSWDKANEPFRNDILLKNSIWFSSTLSFNDPFDSCLPITYENGYEGSIQFYRDYLIKFYDKKSLEVKTEIIDFQAEKLLSSNKNEFGNTIEAAFREFIYNSVGISCFSKKNDSLLMWAHYGDCHQGICLGFDRSNLQNDYGYNLLKVNYERQFYKFKRFGDATEVQKYMLTKFVDWEYEDEYRIIMQDNANKSMPYNKNSLREVIIGMNMGDEKRTIISSYIRKSYPHVQIKVAKRNAETFSIDFK